MKRLPLAILASMGVASLLTGLYYLVLPVEWQNGWVLAGVSLLYPVTIFYICEAAKGGIPFKLEGLRQLAIIGIIGVSALPYVLSPSLTTQRLTAALFLLLFVAAAKWL